MGGEVGVGDVREVGGGKGGRGEVGSWRDGRGRGEIGERGGRWEEGGV